MIKLCILVQSVILQRLSQILYLSCRHWFSLVMLLPCLSCSRSLSTRGGARDEFTSELLDLLWLPTTNNQIAPSIGVFHLTTALFRCCFHRAVYFFLPHCLGMVRKGVVYFFISYFFFLPNRTLCPNKGTYICHFDTCLLQFGYEVQIIP